MKMPAAPKTYVYVKPAERKRPGADAATQLKIRDPGTMKLIPSHGAKVELTTPISRMLRTPKPNRPAPPRLQRGPDLVEITKEQFDKGAQGPASAPAATPAADVKQSDREAKKAAKAAEQASEPKGS